VFKAEGRHEKIPRVLARQSLVLVFLLILAKFNKHTLKPSIPSNLDFLS
jgi:hypothetical protein